MGDSQNHDATLECSRSGGDANRQATLKLEVRFADSAPAWLTSTAQLAELASWSIVTCIDQMTREQLQNPQVAMAMGQVCGAAYKIRSDMEKICAAVEHIYYPGSRSETRTQRQEQAVSPERERVGREQEMLAVLALLGLIDKREGLSVEFVGQNADPTPTVPSHLVIVRDLFEIVGDDVGGEHEFRAETRLEAITLAYEFVRKLVSP